ncbi:short chain dehydrogenase reductase [Microbacterium sp. HM58-2]|nr:short chain dehydrogenase reductase [Microbacterium sp. HM58-2]
MNVTVEPDFVAVRPRDAGTIFAVEKLKPTETVTVTGPPDMSNVPKPTWFPQAFAPASWMPTDVPAAVTAKSELAGAPAGTGAEVTVPVAKAGCETVMLAARSTAAAVSAAAIRRVLRVRRSGCIIGFVALLRVRVGGACT